MKHLKQLKTLMTVMILSLLTTVAISCAEEKEGSKDSGPVTCRVSVSSGEGGTAETTETEVMQGWEVTLTAKPEETYRFVNWTVNNKEVSRENPYIAIVNTSTQFKANFEKDNYALKVTAGEGGSVKSTSEGELLKGTKVTLTATPNEGYSFVNWTLNGEVVSTKNIYTITITSDVEYIANFISYNVTVESGEGGTAKTSKTQVGHNGQVTLTATPQEGYSFVNWTVEGKEVSTQNPYTTTITEDIEIKANFITHKITVIASEGGTAKTSKTQVGHNGQVTLTATPNEDYGFVNWTVEGKEVSTQNPYTTTITADTKFKANFVTLHNVTITASEGGTAKTSKTQVGHNGQVTLTATPNEGYSFVNWTVDGVEVSTQNPYTTTITKDLEIKANFITHKITVIASEGGTAKTSKTQVGHNGQVTLIAIPNEGYSFVNWTVDGVEVSTRYFYTTTITKDIEIKANFNYANGATGLNNSKGYVDLGLSVKWATCNVGATMPEEYGDYFAWGEIKPKQRYDYDNYTSSSNSSTLPLYADAAHVNWGGSWRMPTRAEQDELIDTNNCTWTWITQNGVNGYKVTSKKNGNSIFLPAAGERLNSSLYGAGSSGDYWSSSLSTDSSRAYGLYFDSSDVDWGSGSRYYGLSVRPVCE